MMMMMIIRMMIRMMMMMVMVSFISISISITITIQSRISLLEGGTMNEFGCGGCLMLLLQTLHRPVILAVNLVLAPAIRAPLPPVLMVTFSVACGVLFEYALGTAEASQIFASVRQGLVHPLWWFTEDVSRGYSVCYVLQALHLEV